MTAVPATAAAAPLSWRAGRLAARAAVASCGVLFLGGLVLWARDRRLTGPLWLLPKPWTEAGLRRVSAGLGVPVDAVAVYVMVLELLAAAAGLAAAALLLRGATTGFRLYVASSLALWVTLGETIPALYRAGLGGGAGEILALLQGVGWVSVFAVAYLFPDGRFVPGWSRWAALGWAAYLPFVAVIELVGRSDPTSALETFPLLVLFGTCVVAAVHRYRRVSTPEQRLQTRGVIAALCLWFVVVLVTVATPLRGLLAEVTGAGLLANAVVVLLSYLTSVLLPASITVAILRYRLFEVDVWVNRALVYALLTAAVAASYVLLTAVAGLAWHDDALAAPLAATVVIAVLLHPLRVRAQRWVDRFVYGRRREPYTVLAELGRRLETAVPPDRVLGTLVEQIGTALKLAHVSAEHAGTTVAWPRPTAAPARAEQFPIRWQDRELGTLTVAPRPGDDLGAADRDLLAWLARQAGAAVHAATLNDDLRRSRQRILVAREDERRRLQRNLHDGLGPTLASLYQRVDAARAMLRDDPEGADRLLSDVAGHTRGMVDEIRALVRELRPPELDEFGLAAAVEAAARRFPELPVRVVAGDLPPLEPVVEAAAYRIAVEALTNTARHARATSATVRIDVVDGVLALTVDDDGTGIDPDARGGTGLRSFRERAEELGGRCDVVPRPGGGSSVRARLPIGGLP